jgi:nucleotide-binding universal stress UspA family protein
MRATRWEVLGLLGPPGWQRGPSTDYQNTKKEREMSDFPGKLLLATDGSEDAMLAAQAAISLAGDTGAELHVIHVGPAHVYPPRAAGPSLPMGTDEEIRREAQGVLDWQVDEVKKAGGEVAKAHLRVGKPDEEILRLSEEIVAGLIVIGNQGLGGRFSRMRRFLMGSVSEKVARYARCSVMVIRKDLYDRP